MKHFGVSEWVDYARGIVPEAQAHAMRSHLDQGCSDCRDAAGFQESLTAICRQMASHPVPEWVLRRAKAVFPAQTVVEAPRARRLPVLLIYDSLLSPEPVGLRATWQVGWQALYRSGNCSLDLRVEPELSSGRAAVIGQISDYVAPENSLENVPVLLKAGRSVVAETRSNRFGEFQMEYEQQGRLHLCVYLENGTKRFQVPLKKIASDRSLGDSRLAPVTAAAKPKADQ